MIKTILLRSLLLSLVLVCGGCSTIQTGPLLLGPIPTGLPDLGTLQEGALYRDPKGRFTAVAPEKNLRPKQMPYGVILNIVGELPGDISYLVFAWDKPADLAPGESALIQAAQAIAPMLEQEGFQVQVLRQETLTYRGFPAVDLDLFLTDAKRRRTDRTYISRLVETEAFVYWLYYSKASFFGEPVINDFNRSKAERLFDGVVFLPGTAESIP